MKKLRPLLLTSVIITWALILVKCTNAPDKAADEMTVKSEGGDYGPMKFGAALAAPDSFKVTPGGDTLKYYHEAKTGTGTTTYNYTYDVPYVVVVPKGTVTPPDPGNILPTANAGADKSITLPTNKVFLVGDGGDVDGQFTVAWSKLSGSGVIVNGNTLVNASVEQLTAGTTVMRLTVTDDKGAKATDDMTITVNTEPTPPTPGTTTSFTTTVIPFSDPDLNAPGRGAEQWHDRNDVNVPTEANRVIPRDRYQRFVATRIATATRGSYNWTFFDNLVRESIANKQRLSFGIMTVYGDGNTDHGLVKFADGGFAAYPEWLHNIMMGNSNTSLRPWRFGSYWIPNYNSLDYSNWLLEYHKAIDAHIKTTTINGVAMSSVINIIDIRGVGNWGEWHHYPYVGDYPNKLPAGRMPTFESLKRIVDAHLQGFPDNPLVAMISAHDREFFVNTWNPPAISDYLATAKNNWGGVGYRNDHWGSKETYTWQYLDHPALANVWKTGYVTGEPPGGIVGTDNMDDLTRQLTKYHAAMIGNGNMGNISGNTAVMNNFRAASKAAGYRLVLSGGSITTGTAGKITASWQNVGIAPTYENWNTVYELKNGTTVVWSGVSKFKAKLFLPTSTALVVEDAFPNIPVGTFTLTVKLVDPSGYRDPIPLAIAGRNADGSYTLKK
jgi:hypothetical protein